VPHDAFGNKLSPGDYVVIPFKVDQVSETEDWCNLCLTSLASMPPDHKSKITLGAVNTKQVIRANPGDHTGFKILHISPYGESLERRDLSAKVLLPTSTRNANKQNFGNRT
jgi:hypothetical protein